MLQATGGKVGARVVCSFACLFGVLAAGGISYSFSLVSGRFEAPLEPLQVLTWILLLLVVGGFYSLIIPGLSTPWSIVAGVVYGVMASSTVVAGVIACLKDPIDPNVRRFHEVRCSRVRLVVIDADYIHNQLRNCHPSTTVLDVK